MLSSGVVNYNNMAKRCRRKSPVKMLPYLKPQGGASSKIYVQTIDFLSKIQKHAQGIVHNRVIKNYTSVLSTEYYQSMISMVGWEIIKRHDG